ncbi:hypothetical protein LS71_002700 [Helicobacter jaachi]|uniref:IraD/Gp25-like domain-containing protein n=1 Tax=Helicobacter jaachi TaxID=1677920 RepID=A0A4U8TG37_9HELI|nr:GPW/gp25 family protein [Helicobacter jaachi]TLD97667.1 hypothetical protein LS71_002700 [Helicobacter jaachi]
MYQLSIEENIKRILQTTKHTVPLCPNLGLSQDFIDKPLTQATLLQLKDEILEQIALYEPRINAKDISIEAREGILNIFITTQDTLLQINAL